MQKCGTGLFSNLVYNGLTVEPFTFLTYVLIQSCYLSYLYADVDECLEAVANQRDLCPANTVCVNTIGSFQCVCVPGYELVDGTCQRMLQ